MPTRIRCIVAGVAVLHDTDPLLSPAAELARRTGAELHLVHAVSPGAIALESPQLGAAAAVGGPDFLLEASRTRLAELAAAIDGGVRVYTHIQVGNPGAAITALAAEVGADLVMVGTTRRGRLAGALFGTTAQNVLRHASAPVLVLHEALPERLRVLLTTDLSTHSIAAHSRGLELISALAGPRAARLRTVRVVPAEAADRPTQATLREGWSELSAYLLDGWISEPCVRVGEPAREIMAEAEAWEADLLVLGTHARRGAARWLLGSVAETVLRSATGAVLAIPPRHAPGTEPAPLPAALSAIAG